MDTDPPPVPGELPAAGEAPASGEPSAPGEPWAAGEPPTPSQSAGSSWRLPGHPGRLSRLALATGAVAVVAVAAVLVAAAASGSGPASGSSPAGSGTSRPISFTSTHVTTVELLGVPGQLTVVGAATSQVRLTGPLHWTGQAPRTVTRLDRATGTLLLASQCAPASPCTQDYRLVVPWRTAIRIRQPSGHIVLAGLAGPVRITAASVDISASGLRSPSLVAAITSGHLSAAFATPPRRISVTLRSAQATIRVPASTRYAVSSQVTSGFVHTAIPRGTHRGHTIRARIISGELELLPT
jgi:hypothetical protein